MSIFHFDHLGGWLLAPKSNFISFYQTYPCNLSKCIKISRKIRKWRLFYISTPRGWFLTLKSNCITLTCQKYPCDLSKYIKISRRIQKLRYFFILILVEVVGGRGFPAQKPDFVIFYQKYHCDQSKCIKILCKIRIWRKLFIKSRMIGQNMSLIAICLMENK